MKNNSALPVLGLLVLVMLFFIASCGDANNGRSSTESTSEAIWTETGSISSSNTGVVKIVMTCTGNSSCPLVATGTLLRNDWVMTAAHTFYFADYPPNYNIALYMGTESTTADAYYLHPDYLPYYADKGDIALIHLTAPFTMNGSRANYSAQLSGKPKDLLDSSATVTCRGWGSNSAVPVAAGSGLYSATFTIDATWNPIDGSFGTSDVGGYSFHWNAGHEYQESGDSGMDCITSGGQTTGVVIGYTGSGSSYRSHVLGLTSAMKTWLADTIKPANDDRANAIELNSSTFGSSGAGGQGNAAISLLGTLTDGSFDGPEPGCSCTGSAWGLPTVWYKFTISTTSVVYFDTHGSWDTDTSLYFTDSSGALYDGYGYGSYPNTGHCNDDSGCTGGDWTTSLESRTVARFVAGTYYLAVSGCNRGPFHLEGQYLPSTLGSFLYAYDPLLGSGATSSTNLIGSDLRTGSCGGTAGNSGEDVRYFITCGTATHSFSVCNEDSGSYSATTSSEHDPVVYVRSGRDAAEVSGACNDDGGWSYNCKGLPANDRNWGSRLIGASAPRGINGVFIDCRAGIGSGMYYVLHYSIGG